ncbi:type II toxin-antitoxin system RelE/ParE family toxin [Corticibacterium sp. UT-5YL-CI-8]|nr:type II toxin-antitoxin system RelE/ParE family toxin [Tianweitania sp. UT-5YL-CI-8]
MAYRLIFAPLAERDLAEIDDFISVESPVAAQRMILRFEKAAMMLTERPYVGATVTSPKRRGLRKWTVSPYVIFYRIADEQLQIVRILHSARDIDRQLGAE